MHPLNQEGGGGGGVVVLSFELIRESSYITQDALFSFPYISKQSGIFSPKLAQEL